MVALRGRGVDEATGEVTVHTSRSLMDARGSDAWRLCRLTKGRMDAMCLRTGGEPAQRVRTCVERSPVETRVERWRQVQTPLSSDLCGRAGVARTFHNLTRILFIKTDTARREHMGGRRQGWQGWQGRCPHRKREVKKEVFLFSKNASDVDAVDATTTTFA